MVKSFPLCFFPSVLIISPNHPRSFKYSLSFSLVFFISVLYLTKYTHPVNTNDIFIKDAFFFISFIEYSVSFQSVCQASFRISNYELKFLQGLLRYYSCNHLFQGYLCCHISVFIFCAQFDAILIMKGLSYCNSSILICTLNHMQTFLKLG